MFSREKKVKKHIAIGRKKNKIHTKNLNGKKIDKIFFDYFPCLWEINNDISNSNKQCLEYGVQKLFISCVMKEI